MRGRIPGILASIGLLALLANFSFSDVPIFKVTIKAKQVYVQMRWNTLSLKTSPVVDNEKNVIKNTLLNDFLLCSTAKY